MICREFNQTILFVVVVVASTLMVSVRAKVPDWLPPDIMNMIAEDKARCMAEHGTSQDLIDAVNDGQLPTERSLSCYMYCLFETFSVVDEEGNIEADILVSFMPDSMQGKANAVFGACADEGGADVCEKMYNFGKCIQSKDTSFRDILLSGRDPPLEMKEKISQAIETFLCRKYEEARRKSLTYL